MARYRDADLRRVERSEVRFGWAVPLNQLMLGLKGPARTRFMKHVMECDRFTITRCNTTLYVEKVDCDRRFYPECSLKELDL
jgi:hypothetical protein